MSNLLQNSVSVTLSNNEVHTRTRGVLSAPECRAPAGAARPLAVHSAHQCSAGQAGAGPAVGRAGGRVQGLGQLQTPGGCVSRLPGAPWPRRPGGQHHRDDV